jgi:hypothetical protein
MRSSLRTWHRRSAAVIVLFAFFHIINHLVSLAGVDAHLRWMDGARIVYRQPFVETLLLTCAAFQVGSGLWFVARGWKARRGLMAWVQALSGAYLAFFLLAHVGAVLYGRAILHLDTNFYYAAAGFYVPPFGFFFAPYYFLAVLALFTHLACAAYWQLQEKTPGVRSLAFVTPVAVGAVAALLIVLSLSGKLRPVDPPAKYKATYLTGTP